MAEQNNTLSKAKAVNSAITLANAAELAAHVIIDVAGNDISNSINGSPITLSQLRNIALSRIQQKLKL